MDGNVRALAYLALFTEIGAALFVLSLGGALTGHWLDQQLNTNPILLVAGFLGGAAAGAFVDYRLISRFLARFKD
jgi:putative F0F1-ATPase subunit (Ca2+/Mg2+ transporter)